MTDIAKVEEALRNAHAAGDTEAATRLATYLKEQRATPESPLAKTSSALGAGARAALRSAPPSLAGAAAFLPGASAGAAVGAAVAGPPGAAVGGLVGGVASSMIASGVVQAGENRILDALPKSVLEFMHIDREQREADEKQHPTAVTVGNFVPTMAAMKPGLGGTLGDRAINAVINAAAETGIERVTEGKTDPVRIGLAAVGGAAMRGTESHETVVKSGIKRAAKREGTIMANGWTSPNPQTGQPRHAYTEETYANEVVKAYHTINQQQQAEKLKTLQRLKAIGHDSGKYQSVKEDILANVEDPSHPLNAVGQQYKQQVVAPLQQEVADLRKKIEAYGVDVGEDQRAYIPRITVDNPHPSIFKTAGKLNPNSVQNYLSTKTDRFKNRTAFAIVDGQGNRAIATYDHGSKTLTTWAGNKMTGKDKLSSADYKAGAFKFMGKDVKKDMATVKEIEANTDIRYFHDPVAALVDAKTKMQGVLNNLDFLEAYVSNPKSGSKVALPGMKAPEDWRTVPGMPGRFAGLKYEPHMAEALEDIIGKGGDGFYDKVGNVSRLITGSMFWNPMPHIFNVFSHSIVEKGLIGIVNPLDLPNKVSSTARAIKAVTTQNDDYIRYLKAGGGLMSPSVFNHDFTGQVMTALGNRPEMGAVAKAWGYANPAHLAERVMAASRKSLWGVNDIIMMQAYLEHEGRGQTMAQAIADVDRHIPNYQMPTRVMFHNDLGRFISKSLRDPSVFAFGRYDYNRLASYGHMVTDLIGKDRSIGDRAHALDQLAMLGFTSMVIYPFLMDPIAKALTGDDRATAHRFGAQSIPWWFYEAYEGKKEPATIASSMFLPAPGPKVAAEIMGNRDMWSGKKLFDTPAHAMGFATDQVPPVKEMKDLATGKVTPSQAAVRDFLGIDNAFMSEKQKNAKDKYERMRQRRLERQRYKQRNE